MYIFALTTDYDDSLDLYNFLLYSCTDNHLSVKLIFLRKTVENLDWLLFLVTFQFKYLPEAEICRPETQKKKLN